MRKIYSLYYTCLIILTFYKIIYPQASFTDNIFGSNPQSALISSIEVQPTVITETGNFKMMIGVASDVDSLSIDNGNKYLLYKGQQVSLIKLYDDASHGDNIAGDKIFTTDELSYPDWLLLNEPYFKDEVTYCTTVTFQKANVIYSDKRKVTENIQMQLQCRMINSKFVPIPAIRPIAHDAQMSEHCVNILANAKPPYYEINSNSITKRYYSFFPDDKDFLIMEQLYYPLDNPVAGYFSLVHNDISGIGQPVNFDNSGSFGSSGKLQGTVTTLNGSLTRGLLNHELLHRWAAFLHDSLGMSNGHWKAIERQTSGFGFAWGAFNRFQKISDRSFRAYINQSRPEVSSCNYNDLELYLMGLMDKSEVASPIRTLVNPVYKNSGNDSNTNESYDIFEADSIRDVDINEIAEVQGERLPNSKNSQKEFSSSLIVITNRFLTEVEFAYYDYLMRSYEKQLNPKATTFQIATGGRASMSTKILNDPALVKILEIPILFSPVKDSTLLSNIADFRWSNVPNAEIYLFQLSEDKNFNKIVIADSSLRSNSKLITGLKDSTIYFWRVKAVSQGYFSKWSGTSSISTIKPFSARPVQVLPVNKSKNLSVNTSLIWEKSHNAGKYRLLVAENEKFSTLFLADSSLSDTLKEVKGLKEGQKYYWKVSSINFLGESPFSEIWSFTTLLNGPDSLKANVLSKSKIQLSWNDRSNSESGFIIERKQSANFVLLDTVKANTVNYIDSSAVQFIPYQYRLRAYTPFVLSDYSNIVSTAITDVMERNLIPSDFALFQNYPNPFNPLTVIKYSLPVESKVKVVIYNILGEAVIELVNATQNAGFHELSFNAENFSSGVYYYSLDAKTADGTKVFSGIKKMIVLK